VACGYYHSAVVTAQGEVWTWGHNEYSELGRRQEEKIPGLVEKLPAFM